MIAVFQNIKGLMESNNEFPNISTVGKQDLDERVCDGREALMGWAFVHLETISLYINSEHITLKFLSLRIQF